MCFIAVANLACSAHPTQATTCEVTCYTDPLSLEHLTGNLSTCIRSFGTRSGAFLRRVSKFDAVEPLLDLPHNGQTRCRLSLNAPPIAQRLEGGTAPIAARLDALRRLALPQAQGGGGYPIGVVIAPIMPIDGWRMAYAALLDALADALDFPCDLQFELITHRFTPGSKEVLLRWYPQTQLEMDEATRAAKRNKFGGTKYVYRPEQMHALRDWFERAIAERFPHASMLYWT